MLYEKHTYKICEYEVIRKDSKYVKWQNQDMV